MPQIEEAGATLVAITPELPEWSAKIAKRHKLGFDVLSDLGNEVARQWGLVFSLPEEIRKIYAGFGIDLPKFNGDDSWELPMPARVIIDADGTVRSVETDPDYTVRPEPGDTVKLLKSL